jgi:hypothetical protein
MRTRIFTIGTALALAIGLLTATPAAATYMADISFPGPTAEFYSPFNGPATIAFTFDGSEADATFSLRIRPQGSSAIHTESVFVDADDPSGAKTVQFDWPAVSVNNPRTYEVVVYQSGGPLLQSESFLLRPRLVGITGATPNPFFPWIDDGYKDNANIAFDLAADAQAEGRVYRPNSVGKCCGALLRTDDLGNLTAGSNNWIWDGRDGGGLNLAKGNYFVRIRADDGAVAPALSKATKIAIARTYRATKSTSKAAIAYHHVGPDSPLIAAGSCRVYVYAGVLRILCQTAKVTVYWRWGLADNERIEKASFVIDNPTSGCPRSIRSFGHTDHGSSMTVKDDVAGISASCRVSTAKITYSYPKSS